MAALWFELSPGLRWHTDWLLGAKWHTTSEEVASDYKPNYQWVTKWLRGFVDEETVAVFGNNSFGFVSVSQIGESADAKSRSHFRSWRGTHDLDLVQ